MEREACVCDHGFERPDLCVEIIIIIIIMFKTIHTPTTPICGISSPRRGPSANGSDAWRFGSCGPARKILAIAAADPHQDTKMDGKILLR